MDNLNISNVKIKKIIIIFVHYILLHIHVYIIKFKINNYLINFSDYFAK